MKIGKMIAELQSIQKEHGDKPPFGPQDWVVWDGQSEPRLFPELFGNMNSDELQAWGVRDLRLATPADFDAVIERRRLEVIQLRLARIGCEKSKEESRDDKTS
jgi:hypothetical protein